jgi:hypothetical protein
MWFLWDSSCLLMQSVVRPQRWAACNVISVAIIVAD